MIELTHRILNRLPHGVTLKHGLPQWGTPLVYLLVQPYIAVFGQDSGTFSCHISFTQLCRLWSQDEVSSITLTGGEPRFRAIDI